MQMPQYLEMPSKCHWRRTTAKKHFRKETKEEWIIAETPKPSTQRATHRIFWHRFVFGFKQYSHSLHCGTYSGMTWSPETLVPWFLKEHRRNEQMHDISSKSWSKFICWPGWKPVTPSPTLSTTPAPSCPRTTGNRPSGSHPSNVYASVWHTAECRI